MFEIFKYDNYKSKSVKNHVTYDTKYLQNFSDQLSEFEWIFFAQFSFNCKKKAPNTIQSTESFYTRKLDYNVLVFIIN